MENQPFPQIRIKETAFCIIVLMQLETHFMFLSFSQMLAACSNNNQLGWYYMQRLPHQLDASASAYQLISYFEKTRYWRTWWRKQQVISSRRRSSLLQLDPMTYFGVSFAFSTVLWTREALSFRLSGRVGVGFQSVILSEGSANLSLL